MKKTLFTLALATLATTGFAQSLANVNKSAAQMLPTLNKQMQIAKEGVSAPAKTVTNGVYYQPQGGLWAGYDLFTGLGYPFTMYSVAPFTEITFKNMCTGVPTWTVNDNPVDEEDLDAANNYIGIYSYENMYYGPTVSVGSQSWNYGKNNLYALRNYGDQYYSPIVVTDSVSTMQLVSPVDAYNYRGTYYSPVQSWGSLSTDNMYGSGSIVYEAEETGLSQDITGTSTAVQQVCPAVASPLYVEQIGVNGLSFSKPIADGKKLTLYVTDVATRTSSDGSEYKVAGENILQTLYAESADTLDFKTTSTRNGKTVYQGTVLFSKKTTDALGIPTIEPFVIPAGQEFAIRIAGFDDADIDFGPSALIHQAEYDLAPGRFEVDVPEMETTLLLYYTDCVLNFGFYGMFDKAYIYTAGMFNTDVEGTDYSKIRVSADGKTVTCEGTTQEWLGLPVATATDFFDGETGEAFYDIPNLPSWIRATVDTSSRENYGVNLVEFEFDALPAGETGRVARLTLTSRGGAEANLPILIAQGDADIAAGVEGVEISDMDASKKDSRMFNLAGQQVGKNYKGIVVKNGKKFMNK